MQTSKLPNEKGKHRPMTVRTNQMSLSAQRVSIYVRFIDCNIESFFHAVLHLRWNIVLKAKSWLSFSEIDFERETSSVMFREVHRVSGYPILPMKLQQPVTKSSAHQSYSKRSFFTFIHSICSSCSASARHFRRLYFAPQQSSGDCSSDRHSHRLPAAAMSELSIRSYHTSYAEIVAAATSTRLQVNQARTPGVRN